MSTSKSCERMLDKLDLRTWLLDLRMWTLRFSYLVFKTTCMDEDAPRREAAFSSREYCFPFWWMIEISVIVWALRSIYGEKKPLMGACCVLACYRSLGTHLGVDLAGGWGLFQAYIFALLMMFNVLYLLLNSRSLLEYIFVLYYLCIRIGFLCIWAF